VEVDLVYRDLKSKNLFVETIVGPDFFQKCAPEPPRVQSATSLHGRTVCLVEPDSPNAFVGFYDAGLYYRFHVSGETTSSPATFLLQLVDNVS